MKRVTILMLAILTSGLAAGECTVQAGEAAEAQGVMCLAPLGTGSSLAVRVQLPKDKALAGVRWYNNDGTTAFPRVMLAMAADAFPQRDVAITAAHSVTGVSWGWSELRLAEPMASTSGAVDVIFEVAAGAELTAEGAGGGSAFGYRAEAGGPAAFVSSDGEEWSRLRADCRLLVEPVLVPREEGVAMLAPPAKAKDSAATWTTRLLAPRPNPANPGVTLAFTLARDTRIELSVFDVRGRQVVTLLRGTEAAGTHEVFWQGNDRVGRPVGSGVYLARLSVGEEVFSRRLLLVR